jgi:hypothetical protein
VQTCMLPEVLVRVAGGLEKSSCEAFRQGNGAELKIKPGSKHSCMILLRPFMCSRLNLRSQLSPVLDNRARHRIDVICCCFK